MDFLLKICWSIPCLHPSWKVLTWIEICASLNHRKKTKADGSRLIPRKHTETLVLLSVLIAGYQFNPYSPLLATIHKMLFNVMFLDIKFVEKSALVNLFFIWSFYTWGCDPLSTCLFTLACTPLILLNTCRWGQSLCPNILSFFSIFCQICHIFYPLLLIWIQHRKSAGQQMHYQFILNQ